MDGSRKGLLLDPRTKLLLLVTVMTLMFSTSNEGVMNLVKPVLSLIPFGLLLSERRLKTAGKYVMLYAVCFGLERAALTMFSGLLSFLALAVIFRFFPTIGEEYQAIRDAMKMRGIRFGGKNPFLMVEYRLVPLMVSVVKIGDELSAAALTRGLGAPTKRTNVCQVGFHAQDVAAMFLCAACFVVFLFRNQIVI